MLGKWASIKEAENNNFQNIVLAVQGNQIRVN